MIPWGGSCIQPTDRSAIHTAASTRRHSRPTNQLLNLETARARSYSQTSEEQDECLEHPAPITLYYAEKEICKYLWHMAQKTRRIFLLFEFKLKMDL